MPLVYTKKGSSNGRVLSLDSIKNSQGSIMNSYVPGSGVGATSTYARRAMLHRAIKNGNCKGNCALF